MPMDENEKKELVKKIMEQRKAIWKGESLSDRPLRQPLSFRRVTEEQKLRNEQPTTASIKRQNIPADPANFLDNSISTELAIPDKKGLWKRLTEELRKSSELGWKAFLIIIALIGVIMFGILIGYLMSTTGLMNKLNL